MLPLVITVENSAQQSVRRFAFADSPVRIGRSPFAELQLTEPFVSRWVGTLRFNDRDVTYCNLSTTNPTLVNGRHAGADEEIVVTPDTIIALGELTLRFVRMPVPEADLRRKGKRRPVAQAQPEGASSKTLWLGEDQSAQLRAIALQVRGGSERPPASVQPPPARSAEASTPPPAARSAEPSMPPPARSAEPSTPPPAGVEPARVSPPPSVRPSAPQTSVTQSRVVHVRADGQVTSSPASTPPQAEASRAVPSAPRTPSSAPSASSSVGRSTHGSLPAIAEGIEAKHYQYRGEWEELLLELTRVLEGTPQGERAPLADQLQRRYPQITQEPGFRALLKRLGLEPRKADIPEISEWLHSIAEGVLPTNFRLDTGLTLERILSLLEMLSQSLAEINDAQDSVRRRWLGRAPRGSVLQSDNGRVILAYLLNPKAEWNERVVEVEETLRNVVMHEIALFKATLEGARALLDTLSPEAIAKAEDIDLAQLEEQGGNAGFWQRLKSREEPQTLLWRRFVNTYESLKDGARYQRVFMGRQFARTYLAATGQADTAAEAPSE